MPNAVSELALLNSGQMIPAEFWPDHFTKRMDEDGHRPWWELIPDPGPQLDDEELELQYSEYYGELLRREIEKRNRPADILTTRESIVSFHCPVPPDAAVNEQWTSFVSPDEEEDFVEFKDEDFPVSFHGGNILKLGPGNNHGFDSHGRRGRKPLHKNIQHQTLRNRYHTS